MVFLTVVVAAVRMPAVQGCMSAAVLHSRVAVAGVDVAGVDVAGVDVAASGADPDGSDVVVDDSVCFVA